ncbi:MAG: SRPBCC family protein [Bacteroidota bacterium]
MIINGDIKVAKPIGVCFEYLSDYRNRTQFIPFIDTVRLESAQTVGVGTQYTEIATVLGQDLATTYEVIEYESPNRIVVKALNAPFPIQSTVILESKGEHTLVKIDLDLELKGFLRIGRPLIRNFIRSELSKILKAIREEIVAI